MASNKRRSVGGGAGMAGRRQGVWSLGADKLARRVPRFAAFVDGPHSGDIELTQEQREFLDKFSAGMLEAMSELGGGPEVEGGSDTEAT